MNKIMEAVIWMAVGSGLTIAVFMFLFFRNFWR